MHTPPRHSAGASTVPLQPGLLSRCTRRGRTLRIVVLHRLVGATLGCRLRFQKKAFSPTPPHLRFGTVLINWAEVVQLSPRPPTSCARSLPHNPAHNHTTQTQPSSTTPPLARNNASTLGATPLSAFHLVPCWHTLALAQAPHGQMASVGADAHVNYQSFARAAHHSSGSMMRGWRRSRSRPSHRAQPARASWPAKCQETHHHTAEDQPGGVSRLLPASACAAHGGACPWNRLCRHNPINHAGAGAHLQRT